MQGFRCPARLGRYIRRCASTAVLATAVLLVSHAATVHAADELVVERFERTDGKTDLGQPWRNYTDTAAQGQSRAVTRIMEEGGNHFLRMEVTFGDGSPYPFAGIDTLLEADGQPRDMSAYHGIKLRTRGDASYTIRLMTAPVTDYNDFSAVVSRRRQWTEVAIPFPRFQQNPWWGKQVAFDLTQVKGIGIHLMGAPDAPPAVVEIDDIRFY